ncbi:ATP-binding cassette domain-containing protein [Lentibacillus sediminis]|uniref:ATP-binding cassette domain-containing protein n=1 Tax=Lentibacillus sediminis TaxID=1940529 RepID=UPI000C1C2889|nr:ATP-binding cassette domain-containing protein [Lentibacillus sediminis]
MLELKNISVAYKDKKVLDDLSLTAKPGEIIGVVAPNGTGKTTLFNVIANFLKPGQGEVTFLEEHTYRSEKAELYIRRHLSTFPEQRDLFDELSGVDHLKLYANMWSGTTKHVQRVIDELEMGHYAKKKAGTYSLGMRQRLCFAMMAAADTEMMLMDEVMNGLDMSNVALISRKLLEMKKEQKLIFVASHLLANLDLYADRVLFLKDGDFVHEQDMHSEDDAYIKISLAREQYEELRTMYELPAGHLYIADHLLCIPLAGMKAEEQTMWIERLLPWKEQELTIGSLGTVEYYEKYYLDSK